MPLADKNESTFGMPYQMFKWASAARLCQREVLFVSVGAEELVDPMKWPRKWTSSSPRDSTTSSWRCCCASGGFGIPHGQERRADGGGGPFGVLLPLNDLQPEQLLESFDRMEHSADELRCLIQEKVEVCRERLEEQYTIVFREVVNRECEGA